MTTTQKGLTLLTAQLLLVGSVAAKYAWERHTCPRVWTRATQYDPAQPLRGRYLSLTLHADACGLPRGRNAQQFGWNDAHEWGTQPAQQWRVTPVAKDGKLTVRALPDNSVEGEDLMLRRTAVCSDSTLSESTEFFIAEHAQTPFPLPKGQELWAEVTVPPSGPPRPVQLAISDGKSFRVLNLR